ncbi:MAG: CDP-diacylglycerol--glycerol-3-phosphate 3-phosphatidyltransferase [Proteobacteria bacterium]|nr:CDP-diacylglycerol--glycerol-3-phosphate 3-phosphatidyltransferase [Pseudomonadota bacterium]
MPASLPNLLTFSRIAVIPLLIGGFYLRSPWSDWIPLAVFAAASVTDFLDGWLARAQNLQSSLGRFLDPIADKLLIATTILMLVALDRISGWSVLAALVILLREILVSGLREFLAELHIGVPVSALAKWKTAIQMVALGFLLSGAAGDALLAPLAPGTSTGLATGIGIAGLWAAAALTLYTGGDYLRAGRRHLRKGV